MKFRRYLPTVIAILSAVVITTALPVMAKTKETIDYQKFYDAKTIDLYNKGSRILIDNAEEDKLMLVATPCDEYVYTTVRLNLRDTPNTIVNDNVICTLPENSKVHRVGTTIVGWSVIQIDGINYFMWDEFLTKTEPESYTEITSLEDYLPKKAKDNSYAQQDCVAQDYVEQSNAQPSSYLGTYKLTAYCNCSTCCGQWAGGPTASGTYPTAGRTIACDLPFGTQVLINGHIYTVEDRGVSGNHIDIYFGSHSEALAFGLQYADVYLEG